MNDADLLTALTLLALAALLTLAAFGIFFGLV